MPPPKSKTVGFWFSGLLRIIKSELTEGYLHERIVPVYGMAGTGKTTLARAIFEDPKIGRCFESRVWVRVGPWYERRETYHSILSQLNPEMLSDEGDDEELAEELCRSLRSRKCLIVLDDVWEIQVWHDLQHFLHYKESRVLLTTTIQRVANGCVPFSPSYKLPFLNKEESWLLLREKVFGDQQDEYSLCPRELEKAGKKIAEKCDGLPLLIVTVAGILSKADKTPEYWNEVAEKQNSVFMDAYDQVSNALLPGYNYLPQNLKPCFLYIGILPQDYEISRSKLVNLWSAEGFLGLADYNACERYAAECLVELVSRSVVIVREKVTDLPLVSGNYETVKYHLHSTFLYLCVKEARENKFYRVLSRAEDAEQSMESQRRLCIQNNVLFAIRDSYDSMLSVLAARSLLCTGPYHQYPVLICFGLKLLRVLDSLTIRFYEFPIDVLELIRLRYLSMTYDGELPVSISKLWNLECLIVGRHISLKSSGAPSYLPMEIWDMKELKHLQVTGSDLPDPCETSSLPNLVTLLDVTTHSCTQRVLERIGNLQRLGIIQTGLSTIGTNHEPLSCFDHISHLHRLETLALVVDPTFRYEVVAPPPSVIYSRIVKLSLSGVGYAWEDMKPIASLKELKVLKLRCNACRGKKWVTPRGFPSLTYLLIEDCDLEVWRVGNHRLRSLTRLSLKHCYSLKEIPITIETSLRKIEVIDCNPCAVSWARPMKYRYVDDVYTHSSWNDKKLK